MKSCPVCVESHSSPLSDFARFITFDDLSDILGNSTEYGALEKIWKESLEECKAHLERIMFDDFKKLMKGQPKEVPYPQSPGIGLAGVPEGESMEMGLEVGQSIDDLDLWADPSDMLDDTIENPRLYFGKKRSASYEQKKSSWDVSDMKDANLALLLSTRASEANDEIACTSSFLAGNRALYRKHREMRLAVLQASKQFDMKLTDIHTKTQQTRANLIMKRGSLPPVEVEAERSRDRLEMAAVRCGRERKRARNKTVSDVTGMLLLAEE